MLFVLPASANEKSRLVLVADTHVDLARRLHAESAQVGLVLVDDSAPWQSDSPRGAAERHGALGVLRILAPSSIDLWLFPREGGPYHQLIQAQKDEGDSFAVRVIEEVRARLVELRLPAPDGPAAGEPGAKTDAKLPSIEKGKAPSAGSPSGAENDIPEAPLTSHQAFIELGAGVGGTQAAGGMGVSVHGAFDARIRMAKRFRLTTRALVPFFSSGFDAPEGSASAAPYLFTGQLDYRLICQGEAACLWGGGGAGFLLIDMKGEPAAGYRGKEDRSTAMLVFADLESSFQMASWLSLDVALLMGASLPRPVARFDGRQVATWGRRFGAGMVALSFALGGATHR